MQNQKDFLLHQFSFQKEVPFEHHEYVVSQMLHPSCVVLLPLLFVLQFVAPVPHDLSAVCGLQIKSFIKLSSSIQKTAST
jgi:hypothetical protein